MTMSPMLWGASLACALGGAVAGNALGSTPILDRPTIGSFYQSHEDSVSGREAEDERPPDHYPLKTRAGIVPVAELGMRGLYSQARYRAVAYYQPVEYTAADYGLAEPIERHDVAIDTAGSGYDRPAEVSPVPESAAESEPPPPLQLAAGPATVPAEGRAKMIHVPDVLAMR